MVVRRKAIFKKAAARNLKAKKYANAKRRLTDAFRGIPKRPGRIDLDPREWNGGFDQSPAQQFEDAYNNNQTPAQRLRDVYNNRANVPPQEFEDAFKNNERNKLQALLQQRQFQKPQPGLDDGGIQLDPREWNGGFDQQPPAQQFEDAYRNREAMQHPSVDAMKNNLQSFAPPPQPQIPGGMSERFAGLKDKMDGGLPPRPGMNQRLTEKLRPTQGGGMIHLDPREWNGGFNGGGQKPMPMPGVQRPPMSGGQKPMPMPQLPNPNPMKQMPMANPRRNLIPRPIDPRYKMM